MGPDALLTFTEDLGRRFRLVALAPAALAASFALAVYASGAFGGRPKVDRVVDAATRLSGVELAVLILLVLLLAIVVQPLQPGVLRVAEGYWGTGRIGRWLTRWGSRLQGSRRERLERSSRPGDSADAGSVAAQIALRRRYPPESRLLPTALGNALRAAEHRVGRRYGFDAVIMWPRLYPLLPDGLQATIAAQRTQLDMIVGLTVASGINAVVALVAMLRDGPWVLVALAWAILMVMLWRGAIASAVTYGVAIEAAVDLHHGAVLEQFGLGRPADLRAERDLYRRLTQFLGQDLPPERTAWVTYPSAPDVSSSGESATAAEQVGGS